MTDIRIRDITEADIPLVMDYWFNPANQSYHEKRMPFGEAQKALLRDEGKHLKAQITTPLALRKSSTAIVEYKGKAIGHVLLNDIRDDAQRRMHFHVWPHAVKVKKLGDTLTLLSAIIFASLNYFFLCFEIEHIMGDVSVDNNPANYVLKRMGFTPIQTTEEAYLGHKTLYSRYRFYR